MASVLAKYDLLKLVTNSSLIVGPVLTLYFQITMDPIARLSLATIAFLAAADYLRSAYSVNSAPSALVGPDDKPLTNDKPWNRALKIEQLRLPLLLMLATAAILGFTAFYSLPSLTSPVQIFPGKFRNGGTHVCLVQDKERSSVNQFSIPMNVTAPLTESFARTQSKSVTGERFSVDFAANEFLPPLILAEISVNVTGFQTITQYHDSLKNNADDHLTCENTFGMVTDLPMHFVEISDTTVGKTHTPRFVTRLSKDEVICTPAELTKMQIDHKLLETCIVFITAKHPGVYTYDIEFTFASKVGRYPAQKVHEGRKVMYLNFGNRDSLPALPPLNIESASPVAPEAPPAPPAPPNVETPSTDDEAQSPAA